MRHRHELTDTAYNSGAIRRLIRKMKALACIKPNPTRKRRNATTASDTSPAT